MGGVHLSKHVGQGHHTGLTIDNVEKKEKEMLCHCRGKEKQEEEEHSWLA